MDLASLAGPIELVTAVEESKRFIKLLLAACASQGTANVSAVVGDKHEMQLSDGQFDGARA